MKNYTRFVRNSKNKRIPDCSGKEIHKARVNKYYSSHGSLNIWILLINVLLLPLQRQQCDLMRSGNKCHCFVFDIFKNRISQLEKEISEQDEKISFLKEQLSGKKAFAIPSNSLPNQPQERRSANNNPLNDGIESETPREEAHIVKLNEKRKVVIALGSLLNGKNEVGLSRNLSSPVYYP